MPEPSDHGVTPRQRLVGDRLRELRHRRHLSQEQLALEAQIHRTYIASLESGMRNPSLETLCKLAVALRVDVGELVKGAESIAGRQ